MVLHSCLASRRQRRKRSPIGSFLCVPEGQRGMTRHDEVEKLAEHLILYRTAFGRFSWLLDSR